MPQKGWQITTKSKNSSALKRWLYPLYCAIRGTGGGHLKHKQEVHRRRFIAERRVLEEAEKDTSLFRQNVCPACGERQLPRKEFSSPVGFQFAHCPNDGTVYMDPIPTDETLDRMYNDPAESYLWLRDDAPAAVETAATDEGDYEALRRLIPIAGGKLLDVGCATGGFLQTAKQAFDVEGCELNDATASTARANGLNVRTGRIEDVPGEGIYDVITMLQVIEHIPTPSDTLKTVQRLLKPGGYFYFNTPNVDSASFHKLGRRHIHVSSFGHVSLFTREGLAKLADRTGFKLVAHEDCGGQDFDLHDLLTHCFANGKFVHRMALYNPRLYYASIFADRITFGMLPKIATGHGKQSYQLAVMRKVGSGEPVG